MVNGNETGNMPEFLCAQKVVLPARFQLRNIGLSLLFLKGTGQQKIDHEVGRFSFHGHHDMGFIDYRDLFLDAEDRLFRS